MENQTLVSQAFPLQIVDNSATNYQVFPLQIKNSFVNQCSFLYAQQPILEGDHPVFLKFWVRGAKNAQAFLASPRFAIQSIFHL